MHKLVQKAIFKSICIHHRNSHPETFYKNGALKNFVKFTEKHLCQSFFLIEMQTGGLQLYQKETLVQVFSSEFCKIFTNIYFIKTYQRLILSSLERKKLTKKLSHNTFKLDTLYQLLV